MDIYSLKTYILVVIWIVIDNFSLKFLFSASRVLQYTGKFSLKMCARFA